jgi:hypothetical protein
MNNDSDHVMKRYGSQIYGPEYGRWHLTNEMIEAAEMT